MSEMRTATAPKGPFSLERKNDDGFRIYGLTSAPSLSITREQEGVDNVGVVKVDKDKGERIRNKEDELNKGLDVLTDPVEDLGKAEFVPLHRAIDECVSIQGFDLDVKAVPPQEDIGGSESDALITVEEAMVVAERLHQRGSFFFDGIVIADLRTKNGGLNSALIADTM